MARPPIPPPLQLLGPLLLAPALVGLGALASQGQTPTGQGAPRTTGAMERIDAIVADSQGLQRGLNLARATAIRLNGGLNVYRPASCMYAGISDNPCLLRREERGFLFRFQGGAPGWEQLQLPSTTETEILVSRDGRTVVEVIYNGPTRP
ncbi:MAG: hypothetical protein ACKO3F_01110 [Cyanobium sp.]